MPEVQGGPAAAADIDPQVQAAMIAARLDAGRLEVEQVPEEHGWWLRITSPQMWCELTVRQDGISASWSPLPPPRYGPHPELSAQVASGIAAILLAARAVSPAISTRENCPLFSAAGMALRKAGLKVTMEPRVDTGNLDVVVGLTISNRRSPDAGTVVLNEDGSLGWEWPFPAGISPEDIAARAAAAVHSLLPAPPLAA